MKEHDCFVAFGSCGHLKACIVDNPRWAKITAKEVASYIRDGLRVERMTSADVRAAKWCDCNRKAKQAVLIGEQG